MANMDYVAPFRPAGRLELSTALAPYRGEWNRRWAAHLLRRAGFGGRPAEIERLALLPIGAAVESFVRFPSTQTLPEAPSDLGDDDPAALGPKRQRALGAAQTWWLERMVATPAPLQEKMTLFWHGHFATAMGTKGITSADALRQNQLFRGSALGNARELTLAVSQDPAMLRYLDNFRSERAHPNENYARELMELFTLGIGNYTERDIRESARAFTGWTIDRGTRAFALDPRRHDDGRKTFLGRSGDFDGSDIVEILFQQPAAARWFARKLIRFFVYDDPEPELIEAFAAVIRKNDFNLQPALSLLLRSNVFYSSRAYRALVKSPVEFVVGLHRLCGIDTVHAAELGALGRMGQLLFRPPSVKGWDGGGAWLNSQSVLARENFASALLDSQPPLQGEGWPSTGETPAVAARMLVETILQGDASPAALAHLEAFIEGGSAERVRGAAYLTLAMPAFQLN
jgi:uncharacterized protein (DUF1800 family)